MKSVYIFDACALIAFMNNEEGSDEVEKVLEEAIEGNIEIFMNKINIFEIYYGVYREEGQVIADEAYQRILKQPITIINTLKDEVFRVAGRIKAKYKLSLADSIVLGEAATKNAVVLTSDHHEFDIIEKNENITFHWIR